MAWIESEQSSWNRLTANVRVLCSERTDISLWQNSDQSRVSLLLHARQGAVDFLIFRWNRSDRIIMRRHNVSRLFVVEQVALMRNTALCA